MEDDKGGIIVGFLGQWASGKSTAASTLIKYLGGEGQVTFITDRDLFSSQAVNHILQLESSKVMIGIEDDGTQRLEGEDATVWLYPGEDLKTVDLTTLRFIVEDNVLASWLDSARVALGYQICERSADGKPIVVEAGFGKNPPGHTIPDLLARLEETGVESEQVKWVIVEASFDRRSERNKTRQNGVPVDLFQKFAADGGDLDLEQQTRLENQGMVIRRVTNDHNDLKRFKADIIAVCEEMYSRSLPQQTIPEFPVDSKNRKRDASE